MTPGPAVKGLISRSVITRFSPAGTVKFDAVMAPLGEMGSQKVEVPPGFVSAQSNSTICDAVSALSSVGTGFAFVFPLISTVAPEAKFTVGVPLMPTVVPDAKLTVPATVVVPCAEVGTGFEVVLMTFTFDVELALTGLLVKKLRATARTLSAIANRKILPSFAMVVAFLMRLFLGRFNVDQRCAPSG
jgi:hypothetical protein